jgi:hypothetical protein
MTRVARAFSSRVALRLRFPTRRRVACTTSDGTADFATDVQIRLAGRTVIRRHDGAFEDWIAGEVDSPTINLRPTSPAQQIARARAVLDLCRSWLPAVPAVVTSPRSTTDRYCALLYVAEIAAKII